MFQAFHQLHSPSLDTVEHLDVLPVVNGPKLNTVLKVLPHQSREQGEDHLPAVYTIPDTSQDPGGFLGHLGTLLAHVQASINQHPQILFLCTAFEPVCLEPVALFGVVVAKVQDPALSCVEPYPIGLCPLTHLVQVPLWAFLPSSRSTLSSSLVPSANLLRMHSIPSSKSSIKILKRMGPNTDPWGTGWVTIA